MPFSPEAIDAIAKLGALGFALIAIFALYTRRIRTRGEAEEDKAENDARLAEMRSDRDAWRKLAEDYGNRLDRVTELLEKLLSEGSKVDRLLELVGDVRARLGRLGEVVDRILARVVGS